MKTFSITFIILITTLISFGQENQISGNEPIRTLFGRNKDAKFGWFVEFDNSYTQFDKRDVSLSGFNFGLIVNHNLSLGFSGAGWTNRNDMYFDHIIDSTGAYLEGGMGRFMLEYTLDPKAPVHLTFPVMIGFGGASFSASTRSGDLLIVANSLCYGAYIAVSKNLVRRYSPLTVITWVFIIGSVALAGIPPLAGAGLSALPIAPCRQDH